MEPRFATLVLEALKKARVKIVVGLPDSLLKGVYEAAREDVDLEYVLVTNEAEGASVAAGAWSGGVRSVLVMENSGVRVACEALARLGLVHGIPVVMLMGYRGDIGERFHWGINHGLTMEPLFNAMRIPYLLVDRQDQIVSCITRAVTHAANSMYHVAIVFRHPLVGSSE